MQNYPACKGLRGILGEVTLLKLGTGLQKSKQEVTKVVFPVKHGGKSTRCIKIPLAIGNITKHAYSNILKILQPKKGKFSDKNSNIFHISAQNIGCGYSLEPPR